MKSHKIASNDGTRLHAVESGISDGQPLVFIHGFSQSWRAWQSQFESDLQDDFRLVAVDIRGHGESDKPDNESYKESKVWADDIDALIDALGLRDPILCGWSYGPLIILDYIRHYGEENIGGACFVSGITKLGSEDASAVLTPEFLSLVPGFFSIDITESARALGTLIRLCFNKELSEEDFATMLDYNLSVPQYVRQAMLSRVLDNDDLLPNLRRPLLVVHGAEDKIVRLAAAEQIGSAVNGATIVRVEDSGHAPFREQPDRFNAWLRDFASGKLAAAA